MTTDPVHDAGVYWDKQFDHAERMEKAEIALEEDFIKACLTKVATDFVDFHTTTDFQTRTKRPAKVFEVMQEALDSADESIPAFVMQSLMLCARKGDLDAQAAIRKMAREFARHNAYVEDMR